MPSERKKKKSGQVDMPVPAHLPAVPGLDEHDEYAPGHRPRTWLLTLLAGLVVALVTIYVLVLGGMAIIDGLRDRTATNRQVAQEHYAAGLAHLEAGEYELAGAEFRQAIRYDSSLADARTRLSEAEQKALAQVTPTSETRRDAATTLYTQAVTAYEAGKLAEAVSALDELRGLDGDFQRQNVETMLITAHYQLGVTALREDRLDDAEKGFQAVLAIKPDQTETQEQLNLLRLYRAALSNWGRDWPATVQAFKGLYALAPGYKDVRDRLHDAHLYRAEAYAGEGDWCAASEEYAAAVSVLVLEETVDRRDDAALKCQATAQAPRPTPTPKPGPSATPVPGSATAEPGVTTAPGGASAAVGEGSIAFTSYDALQGRYDVYIVDLAHGAARLLQENASEPALGPAGRRLVFRNRHPSHLGLSVITVGGNDLVEMTVHPEDSTPTWSPDGKQILFASNKHGDRKWRLYVISPGEVRGEGQEWALGRMPSWSSDGQRIAYQGCDERGDNCGIWQIKAGGSDPRRVTTDPSDTAPVWSPDGNRIAFISARTGNWELFVVDVASGQEKRLTDNRAADVAPAWSPDGKRLAFLSNREGAWAVYVLEVASARAQKVIATGDAYPDAVNERLSWVK